MLREAALANDDLDQMAGRYHRYEWLADGGHAAWLPIGDTVLRLIQPGAARESVAAQHMARIGPGHL